MISSTSHGAAPDESDERIEGCEEWQAALRESLQLQEEALALAHVGSWSAQLVAPFTLTWSKQCFEIFGIDEGRAPTAEEHLASVHPDDIQRVRDARFGLIDHDAPFDLEYRIRRPDGAIRWLRAHAGVARDESGKPLRFFGVFQDITDQKLADENLRASEARYRRLIETTSEGVWMIDADAKTTFMNARMASMLGYDAGEALGMSPLDFVVPCERTFVANEIARHAHESQCEIGLVRRDGASLSTLFDCTSIFDEAGRYTGALLMVMDVTERKRTEQALHASEAMFARLSASGLIGVAISDVDGTIHEVNDAYANMLGYSREELQASKVVWTDLTPPESAAAAKAVLEELERSGAALPFETEMIRKDGTRIVVVVGVAVLDYPTCMTFVVDVSQQRRTERALRKSEEQLRQAQKMEAIGRLAGGVAHDFNNLLSIIICCTDLVLEELSPADPIAADLQEVKHAGERAVALTSQLLAFSRQQVLAPRVLNLNETIGEMEQLLRRLVREDIQLSLRLAPTLGKVNADPGQIEQVIMNLVINARDAMPRGGSLVIETSDVELDAAYAEKHLGAKPGHFTRITVTDDGVGMDEATRARIFEPFFTTKAKDKGTGLGLATVLGIVEQSGGHVDVTSEPGKGASFAVYLPRVSDAAVVAPSNHAGPSTLRGSETVLLVEDDDQVRSIATGILRRSGYTVLDAHNAGEALLICEQSDARIDLLLTDVVMPRLSGPAVAERLLRMRPHLRVLYMSGYPDKSIAPHGVLAQDTALLHKPIRPESLLRKVREVLDAA